MPLAGQVALVTGGGRGIGAAISSKLAARGASVCVVYREDEATALALASSLPGAGHAAMRCDVGDAAAVEALVARAADEMGGLDIVVNRVTKGCCNVTSTRVCSDHFLFFRKSIHATRT